MLNEEETISANWDNTANPWADDEIAENLTITGGNIDSTTTIDKDPVITLGTDLSGSVTLSNLSSGTLNATIGANSVALGNDTTGDYVATITAGSGLSSTGATTGENISHTLSLSTLTSNWDAGGYEIRSNTFQSDVATGTAPFIVASTTLVSNLNADLLDGQHSSAFQPAGSYDNYISWTAQDGDTTTYPITSGNVFQIASGTGITSNFTADDVLTITNTGVTSLTGTADQVNVSGSTGAVTLSLPQKIHASATPTFLRLILSQTTGTAPFSVASTTTVTNLSADYLDGQHGAYYAPLANISGTDNYIPRFNGTSALENSVIYDDGTNVGIGTTNPLGDLHITDSSTATLYMSSNGISSSTRLEVGLEGANGQYMAFTTKADGGASGERLRILANGNIGIGTTNPSSILHTYEDPSGSWQQGPLFQLSGDPGNYAYYTDIDSTVARTRLAVYGSTATGDLASTATVLGVEGSKFMVGAGTGMPIYMFANNQYNGKHLVIDTSGNIGLGTATPAQQLHITHGFKQGPITHEAEITRTLGSSVGDYVNVGSITAQVGGFIRFSVRGTSANVVIADSYELENIYYPTQTDWIELPVRDSVAWSGSKLVAVDARQSANGAAVELRLRRRVASSSNTSIDVYLEHDSTFTASSSSGSGATATAGYMASREWQFPVGSGWSNSVSGLFINYGGNVGIGTTGPDAKLEINGNAKIGNAYNAGDSGDLGVGGQIRIGDSANYLYIASNETYETLNATGNVPLALQTGGGNVGIGTTSPSQRLEVYDGIILSSGASGGSLMASNPNNQVASVGLNWLDDVARIRVGGSGAGSNNGLDIQTTGNVSLMRLLHNGNVGIGTTSPEATLDVSGTVKIGSYITASSSSDPYGINIQASPTGGWARAFKFSHSNGSDYGGLFAYSSSGTIQYLNIGPSYNSYWLRFNSSNLYTPLNVGIGTASPGTTLDLGGGSAYINTNATYQLFSSSDKVIQVRNASQSVLSLLTDANVGAGDILGGVYFGRTAGQSDAWRNLVGIRGVAESGPGTVVSAALTFNTNLGEKMRMTSGGNVGIGTTSPSYKLHLEGSSYFHGTARFLGGINAAVTADPGTYIGWNSTGGHGETDFVNNKSSGSYGGFRFYESDGSTLSALMTIRGNTGHVGIGTTSPSYRLHVVDSTQDRVRFEMAYGGIDLVTYANGTSAYSGANALYSFTAGRDLATLVNAGDVRFVFNNSGWVEKMRITKEGNVGIGTTNPSYTLDVASGGIAIHALSSIEMTTTEATIQGINNRSYGFGGIGIYGSATFGFGVYGAVTGGAGGTAGYFTATSGYALRTGNGNVGIGVMTPAYLLQLNTNSAAKPTSNVWTVSSDQRLKENIQSFNDGLDIITQINPVSYQLNGHGGMPKGDKGIGVIAQEVLDILPYSVGTFKAKYNPEDEEEMEFYNFDSNALTFITINAIKEQQDEISTLQSSIGNWDDNNLSVEEKITLIGTTLNGLQTKVSENESRITDAETQLTQLTTTIDNINSFMETANLMLSDHEERLQVLESKVNVAGESVEMPEILGGWSGVLESGTIEFDSEGNFRTNEFRAKFVKSEYLQLEKNEELPSCNEEMMGTLYFNNEDLYFYGCDGNIWKKLEFATENSSENP